MRFGLCKEIIDLFLLTLHLPEVLVLSALLRHVVLELCVEGRVLIVYEAVAWWHHWLVPRRQLWQKRSVL
jgi:hypothetical protein